MRYLVSEKLEIIRTVEQSSLGVQRTRTQIGIPRATFYHWHGRNVEGGLDSLEDRKPGPGPVWNKVPEAIATNWCCWPWPNLSSCPGNCQCGVRRCRGTGRAMTGESLPMARMLPHKLSVPRPAKVSRLVSTR
jgi:hypothetical protein